jgi:hypothetical protein
MDLSARQLATIAELGALLDGLELDHWLFGGWAVDFHAGRITRPHRDIDLAVWQRDATELHRLLVDEGWRHAPLEDEDGGTGYERNGVRLELTFVVAGDAGEILIAFRAGTAVWSKSPFGAEVRELDGVRARIVPRGI